MARKKKIIFLDFDGTLCDASNFFDFNLRKIFNEIDYKISKSSIVKQRGKKISDVIEGLGAAKHKAGLLTKKFYNNTISSVSKDKLKLCCSVKPLLDLKKEGYEFIIVSNNLARFIKKALKVLDIEDLIFDSFGSESFFSKDEILRKLIKKYGLEKKETYFVGDRFSDIILAHKAGMIAVGIHNKYSVSSVKEMLSEDPDYMISDFKGLKKIILKS